jgi:hypothetical protein
MTYQDANGETLSVATRVRYGRPLRDRHQARRLGAEQGRVKFRWWCWTCRASRWPMRPVSVDFFQRQSYSHRRRLIGGFYAYENSSEIKALGAACAAGPTPRPADVRPSRRPPRAT